MTALSATERRDRLRLIRTENIGPITYARLLERFGSATRALEHLPEMAKRGGRMSGLKPASIADADTEMAAADKIGARMIFMGESDYPTLLAACEDAPPVITLIGNAGLMHKKGLGIVGARNASLAGQKIAAHFAGTIGRAGYVITSGLARGIDTAAHEASMATGTIAVVAGGIDVVYPKENRKLYESLCAEGLIVAESPMGTEPIARHFPRRNRIISGLSTGILVVEAAHKSGSLITARMALEQNRDLFAIPGSPLDPRAEGCNALIQDGAHLAQRPEDVIFVLSNSSLRPLQDGASSFRFDGPAPVLPAPLEGAARLDAERAILGLLSLAPVHADDIIRAAGCDAASALGIILELELAGRVARHAGNKIALIASFDQEDMNHARP